MAYSKEYYEKNKDKIKKARDKYRNNPQNREAINKRQREKYQSLSEEEREVKRQKIRDYREMNRDKIRLQNRLSQKNGFLRQYNKKLAEYEEDMFMLKMADHWDNDDFRHSDELHSKIMKLNKKIDRVTDQIVELNKQLGRM